MLEISDFIILFLLGSVGAFVAGFLGVGGGIVYIPILDYFLTKIGFTSEELVKAILANSLFVIIFSGSVASYKQYRIGNFFPKEILYTAIPGVFTAIVMTYLIKSGSWYSKQAFNYVFASMLLVIAVRLFLAKTNATKEKEYVFKKMPFMATGFFAGFITALSGLGGGVLMTPIFTDMLHINIKKASSIANGVIPCFAIAIGFYNISSQATVLMPGWQIGFIILPIVLPMILATFFFAPLGVSVSQKVKPALVRLIFALFVSIILSKLVLNILIGIS